MRMPTARKRATTLTLREDLVRRANELGLNLSGLLEEAILRAIQKAERQQWLDDNQQAIHAANEHFAKHGLFSDQWREL